MDIFKNDLSENPIMKSENPNSLITVDTLIYMDSIDDNKNHMDKDITKNLMNIHTPSPMVGRSCFGETNCDSWNNVSIYSYSRNNINGETENSNAFNHTNKFGVYNVIGENKSHNWINCQQVQNCSPELLRRNDIIFEENTQIENNGDLDNSDYSDRSQSPINSVSSNESSDSSSNSSANSSPEEAAPQELHELSTDTYNAQMLEHENRFIDFNCIFVNNAEEDFFGKRYHQPPKAIDREAAKRLARRLFDCDGFKITDVAKHLSKRNDFSQIVGEEFANFFELADMRLDGALRLFLSKFTLTGDTQERERIMHHFSKRYVTCNNQMYNGEDACHTLVCALIILNTNLHSQTYPKMSSSDFINNLKELNDGDNFPTANLEELYTAIEKEPIRWPLDDELVGIVNLSKPDMMDMSKQLMNTGYTIGFDEPRDSNCRDFMYGYVVRKWLKEPGGRKTAFGKRGWKLYYGRLRDLTIYLYKDHDKSYNQPKAVPKRQNSVKKVKIKSSKHAKKAGSVDSSSVHTENQTNIDKTETDASESNKSNQSNEDNDKSNTDVTNQQGIQSNETRVQDLSPGTDRTQIPPTVIKPTTNSVEALSSNPQPSLILPPADTEIHIHHAFASRATDYLKKKNVFRIKTKYGSEYLFQVNNEKEMDNWIDNINYVAALLSDPEPIIGISTMEKLSSRSIPRPKITNLNVRNQLDSHQKCVLELEKIISNLKENPPKKSEKRNRLEFDESIRFREEELLRYKTYSQLLEFEITKIQTLPNMRCISSGDIPFFCQTYQMSGVNQSVLMPNQGIIVNQQLLNGIPGASDTYMTNPLILNQSSMRFRPPPVLHNLVAITNNRRPRYRIPVPNCLQQQQQQQPPVAVPPHLVNAGGATDQHQQQQSACVMTDISPDGSAHQDSLYSPPVSLSLPLPLPPTNTFYEIV